MTTAIQLYPCDGCRRTGDVIPETPVLSRWDVVAGRFLFADMDSPIDYPLGWVCYCPECREWYREACEEQERERFNEVGCAYAPELLP